MNTERNNRIFGLDLLRSAAILIVVIAHSNILFPFDLNFSIPLPDGVDLFFVLSGYLIGLILLKTIEYYGEINLLITLNFLIRIWFRTLPNYYLFLLINIVLAYYSLIPGQVNKYIVTYPIFFQNFFKPYDFIFWESWSLSVEEWFYFIFPIMLSMMSLFNRTTSKSILKYHFLIGIIVLMLFSLTYRIYQSSVLLDTDLYFRKLVLTRLDTISFGLLAAYIQFNHNAIWRKYSTKAFFCGILIISMLLILGNQSVFFMQTFRFTIMSIGIAFLIPHLSQIKNGGIFTKPITYLSKISYSIYLVHLPVMFLLLNKELNSFSSLFLYIMFWFLTILISHLTYRYYEAPLMNIREKINITKPKLH